MRSVLALVAAALALIAAGVSAVSGEDDVVAFFVTLAVVAGVIAVLCTEPFTRPEAVLIARTLAVAWAIAATWIGALLVGYQTSCACSSTVPLSPDPSVSGIPTTLFHLLATYLGGTLVVVATFSGRLAARGAGRR